MGFLSNLLRKPIENPLNSENFPLFQDFGLFRDFFRFRKIKNKFRKNIFKIQNLSRIPKIILRKSCEQVKCVKNAKTKSWKKICANIVSFRSVLGITTLQLSEVSRNPMPELTKPIRKKKIDWCRTIVADRLLSSSVAKHDRLALWTGGSG